MSHVRRIYIDSRLRSGGTDSDFTYDLPRGIEIPESTIAYVDSVFCPNVFTTLHGLDNRLYVIEGGNGASDERTVLLQEGNYTGEELRALLETSLNANKLLSGNYIVTYEEKTGNYKIANSTGTWFLPTRQDLTTTGGVWSSNTITEADLRVCHDVIGYTTESLYLNGVLTMGGFIDLLPYKTLFLCSSTFGNLGQSVGPVRQGDIVRRIVVNAGFGHLIHDLHSTAAGYVDVSLTQLSQMHWRLTDEKGRVVSLEGHGISFHICFLENRLFKSVVYNIYIYKHGNRGPRCCGARCARRPTAGPGNDICGSHCGATPRQLPRPRLRDMHDCRTRG